MGSRGEGARAVEEFEELAGLRGPGVGDGRGSTYVLEHLATFTVTRETGIVYPADGMRRLLQLEKTNGIWSQKMQLCLDGQWVLVMDYETGSIMERFPATWVHSPTAFTSPEPAELYNNVLAFVVGPPAPPAGTPAAQSAPPPRRELHIFQCHDVGAQTLVEELNALKGIGNGSSGEGGRDFIIERERERERESDIERPRRQQMAAQLGRSGAGSGGDRDDASSTGSDRLYEQDIAILNRCFDDIEKFIARLQHAAAAQRELERRRRARAPKYDRNSAAAGEGMLALRARPPAEREFVDVLQKFKLSFNLLARLRAHIHEPNAPELVHFLFTPLALIVDAAQEAGDARLPHRVVQPLLTRDALTLLANCVTSKETELWHSLGDAWLIPREQWKTSVPPYQPVFMDGWTPDYQVDDTPLRRTSPRRSGSGGAGSAAGPAERDTPATYERDETDLYSEHYTPYSRSGRPIGREDSGSAASSPEREPPYRSDRDDADSLGEAWARGVVARGGRVVRVTYPRTANNDKELTVHRGEYLEVLDDSRKWWKARNRRGMVAHVPHTIVAPTAPPAPTLYPNPIYTHYQEGGSGRGSGGSSPTGATTTGRRGDRGEVRAERDVRGDPRGEVRGERDVRADIRDGRGEMRGDNRDGRAEMRGERGDIREGRGDIREGRGDIREGRSDIREGRSDIREGRGDIREGRGDIRDGRAELRGDLRDGRAEMRGDIRDVRGEMRGDARGEGADWVRRERLGKKGEFRYF